VWIDNIYHENISSSRSYDDAGVIIFSGSHNVYVLNNQFHSQSLLNAHRPIPGGTAPVRPFILLAYGQPRYICFLRATSWTVVSGLHRQ